MFLGLYELVDECTIQPVEYLLRGTIHVCNPEQLLVFRTLPRRLTRLFRVAVTAALLSMSQNPNFRGS